FELPGFTTAASGTALSSLDALRKATTTSYYKGAGSLWVKLVSSGDILGSGPNNGPSGGASLQTNREVANLPHERESPAYGRGLFFRIHGKAPASSSAITYRAILPVP